MRVVVVVEDGENETTSLFVDRTTANAESVDLFIKCISYVSISINYASKLYSSIPIYYN